jgi:RimJ/RimL family protein N-acetyltransferase
VTDHLAKYRNLVTLPDGVRICLRPLVRDDRDKLVELFSRAAPDDLNHLRDNVQDATVIDDWIQHLDHGRVFPLVAVVNERIVGDATLHFKRGPSRHRAEVRIFLDREYRRRGLGTQMLRSLIDIARKQGLQQLLAEVVADQPQVIKAFRELGFEHRATLPDFFMLPDGETRDVAILILPLVRHEGEF